LPSPPADKPHCRESHHIKPISIHRRRATRTFL
jgi:hypothetical protein